MLSTSIGGSITLRSNNPFDKPLINPNYLTTQFDIVTMREAVKASKRYAAAPSFSNYVTGPFGDAFAAATTDDKIDAYVRGLTSTIFHPTGTASMSSSKAKNGVVNADLSVKGTEGLRVVDASVFVSILLTYPGFSSNLMHIWQPYIPSCHTQGPVYLLAERAADIFKSQA
jgi:choline dehydrogenase-like flavoprotein